MFCKQCFGTFLYHYFVRLCIYRGGKILYTLEARVLCARSFGQCAVACDMPYHVCVFAVTGFYAETGGIVRGCWGGECFFLDATCPVVPKRCDRKRTAHREESTRKLVCEIDGDSFLVWPPRVVRALTIIPVADTCLGDRHGKRMRLPAVDLHGAPAVHVAARDVVADLSAETGTIASAFGDELLAELV